MSRRLTTEEIKRLNNLENLIRNKRTVEVKPLSRTSIQWQNILISLSDRLKKFLISGDETEFQIALQELRESFPEEKLKDLLAEIWVHAQRVIPQARENVRIGLGRISPVRSLLQNNALANFVQSTIQENVNLITSNAKLYRDIFLRSQAELAVGESETIRGLFSKSEAAKILGEEVSDSFLRKIQLIAMDQNRKATAALVREKAKSSMFQWYIWTCSRHHTRPSHLLLDGVYFRMDEKAPIWTPKGIKYLFPGEDYNCECIQKFVIDEPTMELVKKQRDRMWSGIGRMVA